MLLECNKCQKILDSSSFYKKKNRSRGFFYSCIECWNKYTKQYEKENPEKVRKLQREHYNKDIENSRMKKRIRYSNNKEEILKTQKQYRIKNPEIYRTNKRNYYYNNYNKNILFTLSHNIRNRIWYAFSKLGLSKSNRVFHLLGYKPIDLKNKLFIYVGKPCEMCNSITLSNDPRNYDIDHITPICLAKNEEDIIKLNQLSNLRLLCNNCNSSKKAVNDKKFKKEMEECKTR